MSALNRSAVESGDRLSWSQMDTGRCRVKTCVRDRTDEHAVIRLQNLFSIIIFVHTVHMRKHRNPCYDRLNRTTPTRARQLCYVNNAKAHDTRTRNSCKLTRTINLYVCHTDLQQDISREGVSRIK